METEKWFYENQTKHTRIGIQTIAQLYEEKTSYQTIKIFDTVEYGRMLVLDDIVQVTELDEFAYHEMLSHVPLHAHPDPQSVLIVGGGDGGTVREVTKHNSVKRIVLAEIDEAVIRSSINYMPSVGVALSNNPKLEIYIGDAVKYVSQAKEQFDLVVVDSSDPRGFAEGLFSSEFYSSVNSLLSESGMVAIQGESPWLNYRPMIKRILSDFKEIFPIAKMYWGNVPTYPAGAMVYPVGSKVADPATPLRIAVPDLRYYSHEIHKAAFILPRYLQVEQM